MGKPFNKIKETRMIPHLWFSKSAILITHFYFFWNTPFQTLQGLIAASGVMETGKQTSQDPERQTQDDQHRFNSVPPKLTARTRLLLAKSKFPRRWLASWHEQTGKWSGTSSCFMRSSNSFCECTRTSAVMVKSKTDSLTVSHFLYFMTGLELNLKPE